MVPPKRLSVLFFILFMAGCILNTPKNKIPIVYHEKYNISFWGIESLHPFDTKKYGKVFKYLIEKGTIRSNQTYIPKMASKQDLLLVHTPDYLASLKDSQTVVIISEITLPIFGVDILKYIPNFFYQRYLLTPMKYATGGTILGTQLALEYGWAINLAGGFHHAKTDEGSGFCYFADIAIAIKKLFKQNSKIKNVMIVDLDNHQGNGNEAIFKEDKNITIFDIYDEQNFPNWGKNLDDTKERIDFNYPVKPGITDNEYLALLKEKLPEALDTLKADEKSPDLIIYNAGTDIYEKDLLGNMKISKKGIIERDEFVFRHVRQRAIPILMVLSGGYTKPDSAQIIAESIDNLFKKKIVG